MKSKYKTLVIIAVGAAVITVLPAPASKPCLLGYYAHCSWTPISTLICLVIAGVIMWIGDKRSSKLLAWLRSGPPGPQGSIEYIRWRADRDAESEAVASEEEGIDKEEAEG